MVRIFRGGVPGVRKACGVFFVERSAVRNNELAKMSRVSIVTR